jgi:hypothetical protein
MQIVNCSLILNDKNCKSGLIYNYQTMKMISAFGPIITGLLEIAYFFFFAECHFGVLAGIFAATLSSALGRKVNLVEFLLIKFI